MSYKSVLLFLCLTFILSIVATCGAIDDNEKAREKYMAAKKQCFEQKWNDAITLLEELLAEFPQGPYSDDALFWIGYCMEKIPDQQMNAFYAFEKLIKNHPSSPWIDDAIVHQISLAELFIRNGSEQFRSFLHEKLYSEMADVRSRAALSLGKLGDKEALSVLKELRDDEDLGPKASELIPILEQKTKGLATDSSGEELQLTFKNKRPTPEELNARKDILFFSNKKYEQYRSMLKDDDDWSREELFDFALWHILETDDYEEYRTLSNEYDKKEWARKFWKKRDPTPTTEENELYNEFERRVQFARAHFSDYWKDQQFKYLQDQFIRPGEYHAPWDARGELYIKYGEPDMRSVSGWHREEWIYYRYKVDFLVKQYMTNIYGNAIGAGELTLKTHDTFNVPYHSGSQWSSLFEKDESVHMNNTVNSYLQAQFIYNNNIRYEYDYQAEPIDVFEMMIDKDMSQKEKMVVLRYRFPVDEFNLQKINGLYRLKYSERFVVFNQDLREVKVNERTVELNNISSDDEKHEEIIKIDLAPGQYTLHLKIKDLQSNKLGIYSKEFTIRY